MLRARSCERGQSLNWWGEWQRVQREWLMTSIYARSAIDWGEIHKGFPHGDFLISSWWKLGFDEVDYPWGCPRYSCPVVYHRKDIILLFPDIDDKNSVNVLVALPSKEMEKFESLFHKFLSAWIFRMKVE